MKVLVYDGFGIWLATRRLNKGRFVWTDGQTIDTDLAVLSVEIEKLAPAVSVEREKQKPKRAPLSTSLPRRDVHHEPESTTCRCEC